MLFSSLDHHDTIYPFSGTLLAHQYLMLLGFVCLYILYVKYCTGLSRVPGPWLASISGIWRFLVVWNQDMPLTSLRLHQKYGPLVRIGPTHVSIADPEALKIIYGPDSRYQKVLLALEPPSFQTLIDTNP